MQLPDGRIYTVTAPGTPLVLSDIRVQVRHSAWARSAGVTPVPPGTRAFATVRLTVTNLGNVARQVTLTQFWLVDGAGHEYLASADPHLTGSLMGARVPAGQTVTGRLVFPTPRRFPGGTLLVYRFADARGIAHARHVGIARL